MMFDDPEEIHVVEAGTPIYLRFPSIRLFSSKNWIFDDFVADITRSKYTGMYIGDGPLYFQNKGPYQKMWSRLEHVIYTNHSKIPQELDTNPRVEVVFRHQEGVLFHGWTYVGNLTLVPPNPNKQATSNE